LALSICETNQLEQIYLHDNNLEERQVTRFIKALRAQRNLREIHLDDNKFLEVDSWNYPGFFPHSKIHRIEIGDNDFSPGIDDECITILTGALVTNKTIKV
jgi:hypothetical protein